MSKTRILIVDDENNFTAMVKLNLEERGDYEVFVENNAFKGYQAAVRYRPHLIFMDVIMPEMEGPDVYHKIKSQESMKDVPIVFLTATVTKEEVQNQKGIIGGRAFIAKPGSVEEIVECIERNALVS